MSKSHFLLIKSTIWEILSNLLGFFVTFLITNQLGISITITLILLVIKSVLLAIYDYYVSKLEESVVR